MAISGQPHSMRRLLFVLLALLPVLSLAQDTPSDPPAETTSPERKLSSLKTIAEPLSASLAEIASLQNELEEAQTEDAKQEIQSRIDAERERLKSLRQNFRDIVGGSEAAEYQDVTPESATLQDQISDLVQPVLSALKEATSEPRELDALKKRLEVAKERERKSELVLERIDTLISQTEDEDTISELESARKVWSSRLAEARSQSAVLGLQVDERTRAKKPVWETLSGGFSSFFRSRGMNLLFAILAAVAGFFATRKLYKWVSHLSPVHKKDKNNFTRISDVVAMTVSILVAISGIIIVFYVRGDWLLLTLVVLFLLGVVWTGKTAIPPYLDQIRMILNLGSVREGERVIYEGLPWKVSRLGFYTTFTNPSLQGGRLRIPIRDVMSMISRPVEGKDVWFPSEVEDWLVLSDETFGKAIIQTPDQVVILQLGGSMKTYPTADFLTMVPENLSHGFRLSITFGIDYMHQAESTTTVPDIFKHTLTKELIGDYGRDAIRSINVEFASAGASSLDYTVLADFDGSVAHRYNALQRKIQSVCVDVCNENDWVIPFAQITVHRAPEEN